MYIKKIVIKLLIDNLYNTLTMISAMTLGCLIGLRIYASALVRTMTKHIWRISKGSAKCSGSSPWNAPFDVAFIGAGQAILVPLGVAIVATLGNLQLIIDSIMKIKRDYNKCHWHMKKTQNKTMKEKFLPLQKLTLNR